LQIDKIAETFKVSKNAEITLEANPDDITEEKLNGWKEVGINRLSIGVQSFFEEDLLWMNRAHNAQQAIDNLQLAIKQFDNIITFSLPTEKEIKELIDLTLKNGQFKFKNKSTANQFIKECKGLSYYSIQKTLINAIKKSLFDKNRPTNSLVTYIDTTIWMELIQSEKKSLSI